MLPLTAVPQSISVVIPVYNGAATVPALINRLRPVLQDLAVPYEIILVNDGSRDASWATIESLAQRYPEIAGIDLMRNYGQHNALLCGIRRSQYDVIVTLDDDLQQPPEEIPRLLSRLGRRATTWCTARPSRSSTACGATSARASPRRRSGRRPAREWRPMVSAFRAFRASVKPAFAGLSKPAPVDRRAAYLGHDRFASVPVRRDPRRVGHVELPAPVRWFGTR